MELPPRPQAQAHVWTGSYRFLRDDPFFGRAVRVGQKYVDEKARGRLKSAGGFNEEMDILREIAPAGGAILLEEMEHRWAHPSAPPTLYVLTMEVFVAPDLVLVAGDRRLGQRTWSTKVGKASRSLAPRLSIYAGPKGVRAADITPGSIELRSVIYGAGAAMPPESELQRFARAAGALLEVENVQGQRRSVTSESYWGVDLVENIAEFARRALAN